MNHRDLIRAAKLLLAFAAAALAPTLAADAAPPAADYEQRIVEVPMRDGVKLHTVILVPHGATRAPIVLNRTPFGAERRLKLTAPQLAAAVPLLYRELATHGYILAFQDLRGKPPSGGDYVIQRPPVGPLNRTGVDQATDAWDTTDWLVKHVPEGNGRVGMIGVSYDGYTVVSALADPHPALRAAVPINPLVDGWKGDDWFENGAFRQIMMPFVFYEGGGLKGGGRWPPVPGLDDYAMLLKAGSAGAYAAAAGLDKLPDWRTLIAHPAYDAFWREQALQTRLAHAPRHVPALYVASLWDQEDIYGAPHAFAAATARGRTNRGDVLVLGPWVHGQVNEDGTRTGPLQWSADTSAQFRREMLLPFLDRQLKAGAPDPKLAPVMAFETGTGVWKRYPSWPRSCAAGCAARSKPLYLQPGGRLGFAPPAPGGQPFDAYVSDPADPVPYSPRPNQVVSVIGPRWSTWLLEDQRKVSARPDVLTYVSEPLTAPLRIAGEPAVRLFAATSGSDSDWVVKLIDVYPDGAASPPGLAGYQLAVGMAIFRGRYRHDPARPAPITPGKVEAYRFALPTANHVFAPGHRIMVQVQSSWFPLYDRNPQTFVDNIFLAGPADYRPATQRIFHAGRQASLVELPVVAR